MSKPTYQQRSSQSTRIPVSQQRTTSGRVLEDNRVAFAAKQLKQIEATQAKFSDQGPPVQREEPSVKPNNTGLPDSLKSGVEALSGLSMDNVKVHYNSAKPAQLNALAYAQGTDIHVGPGQEKHLPHEAWHVVQQAQGRVKPTMQMKDGMSVNNDKRLEREADVMGGRAAAGVTQAITGLTKPSALHTASDLKCAHQAEKQNMQTKIQINSPVQLFVGAANTAQDGDDVPTTLHEDFVRRHVAENEEEARTQTLLRHTSNDAPIGMLQGVLPNSLAPRQNWENAISESDVTLPPVDSWGGAYGYDDADEYIVELAQVTVDGWEVRGIAPNVVATASNIQKTVGGRWRVAGGTTDDSDESNLVNSTVSDTNVDVEVDHLG